MKLRFYRTELSGWGRVRLYKFEGSASGLKTVLLCILLAFPMGAADARVIEEFNSGWRFKHSDPIGTSNLNYANLRPWLLAVGGDFTTNPVLRAYTPPPYQPVTNVPYIDPAYDDSDWRLVDLPHDWGVESEFRQEYPSATGKLRWWGVGWYRKQFFVPWEDRGKRLYLDVDGAMSYATVWVNGSFAGGWPYGYSSFRIDLTPFVLFGRTNTIAIRLDNPPASSRWYPGGGIYRNVRLVKTHPVHVAQWGTFVSVREIAPLYATVDVQILLDNHTTNATLVRVRNQVRFLGQLGPLTPPVPDLKPSQSKHELEWMPRVVRAPLIEVSTNLNIPPNSKETVALTFHIPDPKLWSPDQPNLYNLITVLEQDGRVIDRYETVFGVRVVQFDAERGLILNGRPIKVQGVCNHHDLGPLGAAINVRALERQLQLLKEMGVNAIRTSHNPPAPELLDLCDRLGIMVVDEAFDCWRKGKTPNDYHLLFEDWFEKDLRAMIRRDRNHPSIILWSIGNEVGEQGEPDGWKLAKLLVDICKQEDPTRLVTAACDRPQSETNGFQTVLDVFGFNYKPYRYTEFHKANPQKPVIGTETASCVSSRGEYFFPVSTNKLEGRANFHVSSYDLYAPPWANPPDVEFRSLDENPFVAGEFVWTGFDYLGEPTPFDRDSAQMLVFTDPLVVAQKAEELEKTGVIRVPSRSSYFGILDLCGFPKDRFYLYQARWRPDFPMVHILPHWNWPERVGLLTPVHVYTSGDEVELFLNNQSLGRQKRQPYQYRFVWDNVVYVPGELRAVVYKDGKFWAEKTVRTTGEPAVVKLTVDRNRIWADGRDLAFITAAIVDEAGQVVPRTKNRVRFFIHGAGEIISTCNGDQTCHVPFYSKEIPVFNGLALAIVRGFPNAPGKITVEVESPGLKPGSVEITTFAPSTKTIK